MSQGAPIRVAIVGGGLSGASLMYPLLRHPHLDVHIFESAPAFREAGAAIGLSRYAIEALRLMGTLDRLYKAGAVPMHAAHVMLAQGPGAGEEVCRIEADRKAQTSVVHRASFVHELLDDVPAERMHAGKKLVAIENPGAELPGDMSPIKLTFGDGTTHECDILIGADGIHSQVRQHILGSEDPASYAVPAGWWVIVSLQPYIEVQSRIGKEFIDIDNAREYMWIGDGAYMLTNILNSGELVQFAIAVKCDSDQVSGQWQKTVTAEEIKSTYEDWPPHLKKAVIEPTQPGYYFWEHLPAKTYVRGGACITGDAAHSTTPWMGAGGAISIEDSMILSSLLGLTRNVSDARVALQVFDEVRRPRTQQVVELSRGTGMIVTGRDPEFGLDLSKLQADLRPRWDPLREVNNTSHRDTAVRLLEERIKKQ